MKGISFRHNVSVKDSMVFESVYEEALQSDLKDKSDMLHNGDTSWLFVDDKIAGEAQSISVKKLCKIEEDEMEDINDPRYLTEKSTYLYSFTILPAYEGKGYGKILLAYHLGYLRGRGYSLFISHGTAPGMVALFKKFGGFFTEDGCHKKWYGTTRTAHFCEIRLSDKLSYKQSDDFSCGVYALKYLLDKSSSYSYTTEYIRNRLQPNRKVGTDCERIEHFFSAEGISFKSGNCQSIEKYLRPMIVRYIDLDENKHEHYGVIVGKEKNIVLIFDPWIGKVRKFDCEDFENNWHSEKYGKRWGLYL